MRATSSIRSISRVRSRRQLGGIDCRPRCGVGRAVSTLPSATRISRTALGRHVDAQDPLQLRRAAARPARAAAAAGRRRPRRRPIRRRPVRGSTRSSGGWPNRALRDRPAARSDRTNRCAGSAAGRCCGSRPDRTRPPRPARRVVVPEISVCAPPITPPMATGSFGVGRSRTSRARARRSCGRSPRSFRPAAGRRTMISPPFELGEIERVQRLAALHQHVVADIDHVVDRRHADRLQPPGHPLAGSGRSSRRESPGPCNAEHRSGQSIRTLTSLSTGVLPSAGLRGGQRQRRCPTARRFPGRCRCGPGSRADCWSPPGRWPDRRRPPRSLSWFSPAIISRRSNSSSGMSSGTYCFSQFQETIMGAVRSGLGIDTNVTNRFKTGARTARRSCRTRGCR